MKHIEVNDPTFLPHHGCDLRVTLAEGEALVLTGENGIGKSTLLDRLFASLKPEERVMVAQKATEFFFDRDLRGVKEIILDGSLPHFDEEFFHELWESFHLHTKEDRLLSHLSGGEAQALKLALALCKNVPYYILDEPSQFLDKERKETLLRVLIKLLGKKKCILVVEHNRDWIPRSWRVEKLVIKETKLTLEAAWTTSS